MKLFTLSADLKLETKSFQEGITKARQKAEEAKTAMQKIGEGTQKAEAGLKSAAAAAQKMVTEAGKLSQGKRGAEELAHGTEKVEKGAKKAQESIEKMDDSAKKPIKLDADTRGIKEKINDVQSAMLKMQSAAQRIANIIKLAVVAGAIEKIGSYVAKTGIAYNQQMDDYTANMQTLLGGVDKAEAKIKELSDMAAKTPFELPTLADATQTLLAFGVKAEDSTGILKSLGDISLGNASKLETLTRSYGKMSSTGKVTLENVQMMIDAGFNPLNLIAERNHMTMENLYKALSDGKVPFDELTWAIQKATSEGGQFYNGMETASKTLTGRLSTLKENWSAFLALLTKPAYETLRDTILPSAIDMVDKLTASFNESGLQGVLNTFSAEVGKLGKSIASKITEYFDSDQAKTDLQNATGKIAKLLTGGNIVLSDVLSFGNGLIKKIGDTFSDETVAANMSKIAEQIVSGIVTVKAERTTAIINGIGIAADIATAILNGAANAVANGDVEKLVNSIGDAIVNLLENAPSKITKLMLAGAKIGVAFVASIAKSIPNAARKIVDALSNMFTEENQTEMKSAFDDFAEFVTHLFDSPDTKALYDALDGIKNKVTAIQTSVKNAETEYVASIADIKTRSEMAETYLQTIETLQSKETVNDSDLNAWKEATNKLIALYPDLLSQVDTETGTFKTNTAEIRANIQAMKDQAVEAAKSKLMSAYTDSMADLVNQQVDAQSKINEIQQGIVALAEEYGAVKNQYGQYEMPAGYTTMSADSDKYSNLGNRLLGVSVAEERASEFTKKYNEFLQLLADAESGKAQIDTAVDNLAKEQSTKLETLNAMYGNTSEQAKTAKTDVDAVTEAIDKIPENKESTITITTVQQTVQKPLVAPKGYTWKPHATGLYDVPYDGYAAILHAGERVLTRAQADEYRKGGGGSAESKQDIYNINIQSTAESPSETAAYIKQAMRTLRFNQA